MTAYYVLVFGILSCFFGSVIYALHWSIRHGQFSDYQKGAASIFEEGELGRLDDCYPDMEPPEESA